MSNKPGHFLKPKLLKKYPISKSPASTISSSLYSGIASAERAIQKPGPTPTIRTKHSNERIVSFASETPVVTPQFHSWELDYQQFFTRDTPKRSMTKDPYTPKIHSMAHANETITTEEECCPILISANDVIQTEKSIIHGETKSFLPNIVRYVRSTEVTSSEHFAQQMLMKKSSISQLQIETKESLPMIAMNKTNGITLSLTTTDRLLNRATMRNDTSVVRRPSRKSFMDTIQETMTTLSVYG